MIHCSKDKSSAEQVRFPYGYVNLTGPKARVCYRCTKARLIAYINFCYKTRPGNRRWRRAVPDLRLLSRDAHIFGSTHNNRGGWRVRVFLGLLSFVCCTWCPGARRGGSPGPHIALKGTDHRLMPRDRYSFSSDSTKISDSRSRVFVSGIREFYFFYTEIKHREVENFSSARALILIDRYLNSPYLCLRSIIVRYPCIKSIMRRKIYRNRKKNATFVPLSVSCDSRNECRIIRIDRVRRALSEY